MLDNVIKVVNQIRKDEGILDGIHFCNILKESTLDNMHRDVYSQDDSSCTSDKSWGMSEDGGQIY